MFGVVSFPYIFYD